MEIISLTPTVNSMSCTEVNDTVADIGFLPLTSQASYYLSHVACLDKGTEYQVNITRLVFGPQEFVTFELDSVSNHKIL